MLLHTADCMQCLEIKIAMSMSSSAFKVEDSALVSHKGSFSSEPVDRMVFSELVKIRDQLKV